jgi:serine/threonine protein kinase
MIRKKEMIQNKPMLQNRYTLLRQLGQGGMGVVYLAEDNRLTNRQVAIKELSLAMIPAHEQQSRLEAFQQEAGILAQLRHPGIAQVSDFFIENHSAYVVMEYVPGQSLAQLLSQQPGQHLSPDRAIELTQQLCQALDYLHRQRPPLIYRDLKPENVIVEPGGQVKLIDFGIARLFKPGQQQDTVAMGTPGYAAPEQYGRAQTDPRSDIYSLGIMLHQMVTGQDPTQRTPFTPLNWSNLPATDRLPSLKSVILKATQLQPDARYHSVGEMGADLPAHASSNPSLHQLKWVVLGTVLLATALMIGLLTWRLSREPATPLAESNIAAQTAAALVTSTPPETIPPLPKAAVSPTALAATPEPKPALTAAPDADLMVNQPVPLPVPGDQLTAMSNHPSDEYAPSFSPDQSHFVFMSNQTGSWQIYTAPVTGGDWQAVTQNSADNYHPRYSPDGQRIVLASRQDGAWNIYTVTVDGSDWRQLTNRPEPDFYPSYDPLGEWIVYMSQIDSQWGIFLMRADGSDNQLVITTTVQPYPMFSPDGQQIVYMDDSGNSNLDIYRISRTGQSRLRLTSGSARDANPVYTPDGDWILFETNRDGHYDIYAMRPDGSGLRNLTNHPADDQLPMVSPDGQWIIFQSRRSGNWDIYRQPFAPEATAPPTTVIELEIAATQPRTATGLFVQSGQQVNVEYVGGAWRAGPLPTWPLVGPDGDPQVASKSSFPVPTAPVMTLIVGVGNGRPLAVGQRLQFTSLASGNLWLGPNDDNVTDNAGSLTVSILLSD